MTIYRTGGKILRRDTYGGIAQQEECCCFEGDCCSLGRSVIAFFGSGGGAYAGCEIEITWNLFTSAPAGETWWYADLIDTCFDPASFRIWFKCEETPTDCNSKYFARITTPTGQDNPPFNTDTGWFAPDVCPPCECRDNTTPTAWFDLITRLGFSGINECCPGLGPGNATAYLGVGQEVHLLRPLGCDLYPYKNNPPDNNQPIPVCIRMLEDIALGTSAVNVCFDVDIFDSNSTSNRYIRTGIDASAICAELCPAAGDHTFDLTVEFNIQRTCGCGQTYIDFYLTQTQGTSCQLINSNGPGSSGNKCVCECSTSGHFSWPPDHRIIWEGWNIQGCGGMFPVIGKLEVYVFEEDPLDPDDGACEPTLAGALGDDVIIHSPINGTDPFNDPTTLDFLDKIIKNKEVQKWKDEM